MRTAISSLILPALVIAAIPSPAQAAFWQRLGWGTVRSSGWRQVTIPVRRGPTLSRLRLCAEQNRIRFTEARVRFMNNRFQTIPMHSNVARGSCTRTLWLSGSRRNVSSVRVTTSQPNRRTAWARIRVEGR